VRRQVGRLVSGVVVVAAVATGCGSGPGQAGSAAIVGGTAIPLSAVQSQLDVALTRTEQVEQLAAQGGGPPDISRSIVTTEVLGELLSRRAAEEGVVVTDAQIEARLAEAGGAEQVLASSIYDAPTLRERVRDDLVATELGRRVIGTVVTADLVAATSEEEAGEKARALAAGGPAADALFADPRISRRGEVYDSATTPEVASVVLFGAPTGSVVAFQPAADQSGWIVARIADRRQGPPPPAAALEAIGGAQLLAIGERSVQPVADEVGVRVNPRYGVWDPVSLRVVPEDQRTGLVLPPSAG
jgi:hypothetical protein